MKKLFTVLTAIVASSAIYAAPVLNPAAPALITDGVFLCDDDCWGLKAGYRGNFIYNAHLQYIDDLEYYSNSGVLTLNLWDRVDVYGFVGAASINFFDTATDNDLLTGYYGSSKTNWGVGVKVVLWESCWGNCGTTYLGIDANYERLPNHNMIVWDAADALRQTSFGFYETQVAIGLSHRIWNLVPYIAVKWSNRGINGSLQYDGTNLSPGSRNTNKHWGYVIGTTLVDANRMTVTAEARFVDEKALSIGAEFKF
jgi:hypothetical protein